MNSIVKSQARPNFDAFLTAMWLMYARAPKQEKPDLDGFYSLGEIGEAPEKEWTRLTPYSIARKEKHGYDASPDSRTLTVQP